MTAQLIMVFILGFIIGILVMLKFNRLNNSIKQEEISMLKDEVKIYQETFKKYNITIQFMKSL